MLLVPGISQPPPGFPSPLGEKSLRVQVIILVIPLAKPALPVKGIQQKKDLWSPNCSHKPFLPSLTCQSRILTGLFQHSKFCSSMDLKTWCIQRCRKPECQALSDLVSHPLRIWHICPIFQLLQSQASQPPKAPHSRVWSELMETACYCKTNPLCWSLCYTATESHLHKTPKLICCWNNWASCHQDCAVFSLQSV